MTWEGGQAGAFRGRRAIAVAERQRFERVVPSNQATRLGDAARRSVEK
jgi:hypothetical protein